MNTKISSLFFLFIVLCFNALQSTHHVGVFCATNEEIPSLYKKEAFELGQSLAQSGFALVTGGGNTGLMNAVMNGFSSATDPVQMHAFIPSIFKTLNVHHLKIPQSNLIWTDTLHQRLQGFHDVCDTIVVLPGGFGTLHELMDFIVPKQWGLTQTTILLLNIDHYWDHQLLQFKTMVEKNMLKQKHLDLLKVVGSVEECMEALTNQAVLPAHAGLSERYWEESSAKTQKPQRRGED